MPAQTSRLSILPGKESTLMDTDIRTARLELETDASGKTYISYDDSFEDTDVPELRVLIARRQDKAPKESAEPGDADGSSDAREFMVFYQKAMAYGDLGEYMSKHGCASCAFTTVLRAFSDKHKDLRPDDIVKKIEPTYFKRAEWLFNYKRPMLLQMPVTLCGISKILRAEGIANRYIKSFEDDAAVAEITEHLLSGRPVMVETSRKRREGGKIVARNDKKYAGTNHTQVLLGVTREGKVVYADSAGRPWAGSRQRLKETDLSDMINYMFPQQVPSNANYYIGRKRTGGYILIDEKI